MTPTVLSPLGTLAQWKFMCTCVGDAHTQTSVIRDFSKKGEVGHIFCFDALFFGTKTVLSFEYCRDMSI